MLGSAARAPHKIIALDEYHSYGDSTESCLWKPPRWGNLLFYLCLTWLDYVLKGFQVLFWSSNEALPLHRSKLHCQKAVEPCSASAQDVLLTTCHPLWSDHPVYPQLLWTQSFQCKEEEAGKRSRPTSSTTRASDHCSFTVAEAKKPHPELAFPVILSFFPTPTTQIQDINICPGKPKGSHQAHASAVLLKIRIGRRITCTYCLMESK